METASSSLTIELKRITNSLAQSSHQIENVLHQQCDANDIPNPQKLVHRLNALTATFESLSTKINDLKSTSPHLVTTTAALLLENNHTLELLSQQVGFDSTTARNPFASKVLANTNSDEEIKECILVLISQLEMSNESEEQPSHQIGSLLDKLNSTSFSLSSKFPNNNNSKKSKKHQFTPITIEEFTNLSDSTKGRCKLDDCNNVLRYLFGVYNDTTKAVPRPSLSCLSNSNSNSNSNTGTSTISDLSSSLSSVSKTSSSILQMNAAGLKVTGLTGSNVLRTLQQLNKVERTPSGDVSLCL